MAASVQVAPQIAARPEPRFDGVDVLRGLSIIAVVLLHIQIRIPFEKTPVGAMLSRNSINVLFRSGYYGVKIFFVISGFLITTSILKRWGTLDKIDLKAFYKLRFARIAPCLLALLAVISALHLAGVPGFVIRPERASLPRALAAALTFHVNWLEARVGYLPASWNVLWSLSVEETFYFLFPLMCRFVTKGFALGLAAAALILIGPFARTVFAYNDIWSDEAYLAGMDGIAMGCVAALLAHSVNVSAGARRILRLAGFVCFVFIMIFRRQAFLLGLSGTGLNETVLMAGTALLIFTMPQTASAHRFTGPLRWFGRNSYEVYLTHSFVVVWGMQLFTAAGASMNWAPLWFVGMLAASGVLGHMVARGFSEPVNRALRGRFAEKSLLRLHA